MFKTLQPPPGFPVEPLPIEPLYDVQFVAMLLPCEPGTLRRYINAKHFMARFPIRRYRKVGNVHRLIRLLNRDEVRYLRHHYVIEKPR